MATFKDYLASDNDIFFNTDEFGELHNINGNNMTIMIDNDLLKERQIKSAEGTYTGNLLFSVRASEFGEKPAIEQIIKYDTKPMRVTDCQEDAGIYIITLEGNLS